MKQKLSLTQKQEFALEAFAKINGRCWKHDLSDAWMTGNYPYGSDVVSLQQVRNSFGPSWLASYQLPKQGTSPADKVEIGDFVLIHGHVAEVTEKLLGGFCYKTSAGENLAYNAKWPISPEPKRIWILEQ